MANDLCSLTSKPTTATRVLAGCALPALALMLAAIALRSHARSSPQSVDIGKVLSAEMRRCGGNPCTLTLPAGSFTISAGIVLRPGDSLKGYSAAATRLVFTGTGAAIAVSGGSSPHEAASTKVADLAVVGPGVETGAVGIAVGQAASSPGPSQVVRFDATSISVSNFSLGLKLAGGTAAIYLADDSFESNFVGIDANEGIDPRTSVVAVASVVTGSTSAGISAGAGTWTFIGARFADNGQSFLLGHRAMARCIGCTPGVLDGAPGGLIEPVQHGQAATGSETGSGNGFRGSGTKGVAWPTTWPSAGAIVTRNDGSPVAGASHVQGSDGKKLFTLASSDAISAACREFGEKPGVVVVPPGSPGGGFVPSLPAGCTVFDERMNGGSYAFEAYKQLLNPEQYGFIFTTNGISDDSNIALSGIVNPAVSGTNVVGVMGEVWSANSPAVAGENYGSGGRGGPAVQGDAHLHGGIGLLGTGCGEGTGTAADPCVAVEARAVGASVYDGNIGLYARNDNGLAVAGVLTTPQDSLNPPTVADFQTQMNSGSQITITSLVGGSRWALHTNATSSECGGVATFSIEDQSAGDCVAVFDGSGSSYALNVGARHVSTRPSSVFGWWATAPSKIDTGLSRTAADSVGVGNGTPGDTSGSLTAAIVNVGDSLTVGSGSAIQGILLASAPLAFTAIAAQSCEETTATLNHSSMAGAVSASPEGPLGTNLFWSARVSAPGVVSIRVCNPTSATITPTTVLWAIEVVQ